jgi:hypothetical protein
MGHPIRYAVTVKCKEVAWEKVEGDIDNIKESNETYTLNVEEERRKWIWEVHMSSIHHVGSVNLLFSSYTWKATTCTRKGSSMLSEYLVMKVLALLFT